MSTVFRFELGSFACVAIRDGGRTSTIGQEIVEVSAQDLSAAIRALDPTAPGTETPVEVGYNVLFVDTGMYKVLVDTGTGRGDLVPALQEMGMDPGQIDTVVITHGDGDHIGGLLNEAGEPVFANARYVLWQEAHAQWTDPDRRTHLIDQFIPLFRRRGVDETQLARMAEGRAAYGTHTLPRIRDRLDLVELEQEFLPGMRLVDGLGHRSDHVALLVDGGGAMLLHAVDAVRHPVQMARPAWNGALDSFPAQCAATRRRLLARAAQADTLLFAAHLPFPGLGRVELHADGFGWMPYPTD